jgi:hypothetical protein
VTGDETSGPLPGALPFLDSLYVGGVSANVRYAGRSGCCAGVDQVIFDVPAGVSGCYVPVAAVTGGVVSNFGTISVAGSGRECDDPLSYRAADLVTAARNGGLRTGLISLSGVSGEIDFSAGFFATDFNTVLGATSRVNPPLGSCYLAVSRVGSSPSPVGTGLNAGGSITVSGPVGQLAASNTSSGGYFTSKSPASLSQGSYSFSSAGGSDVGPFSATLTMAAPAVWTNLSTYTTASVASANPLVFTWSGADPAGYVTVRVSSENAIYNSAVQCNAAPGAGTFTLPAFLMRALFTSPITVSLTSTGAPVTFPATGIDKGSITASATTAVNTTLQPIAQ